MTNPNVYAPPAPLEEVPLPNQEWTNETPDRLELEGILQDARTVEMDEVRAGQRDRQLQEAQDLQQQAYRDGDNSLVNFYQRQIDQLAPAIMQGYTNRANRRDDVDNRLDDLSDRTNPRALLNEMRRERASAGQIRTDARDAATASANQSRNAENTYSASLLEWHRTMRHNAANPAATADERRDRQRAMQALDARVSGHVRAGRMSEAANERRQRQAMYREAYPDVVDELTDRMELRHEAAWYAAARAEQRATGELGRWGLNDDPDDPVLTEQEIRSDLEDMRAAIEAMTPYDSTRAEALASYTRLRYRLEQRCLTQDLLHAKTIPGFQVNRDREYTENRGIWIRDNNGDEVIIHDDGTTERPEHGEWVRYNATGEVWTQPESERGLNLVLNQADIEASRPVDQTFAEWDVHRTPESAQALYNSLSREINEGNVIEGQHTQAINELADQIDQIDAFLADAPTNLGAANGELGTAQSELATAQTDLANLPSTFGDPANPNRGERKALKNQQEIVSKRQEAVDQRQQAVDELRNRINQANANRPVLVQRATDEYNARRAMRTDLNERRYWHGFLEVNSNRTVTETRVRRFGGQVITREVERETDALPNTPDLTREGGVNFDLATINSVESDNWVMWADGSAARFDASGNRVDYRPDGTII